MLKNQELPVYCYNVQSFVQKHREMDVAYYGKPYDDQDKYQLALQGNRHELIRFVSDLKQQKGHPYIAFVDSLIDVHLRKIAQMPEQSSQSYEVTLYHVGSRYGQKQELTGWLNWIEAKKVDYPELELELRFSHISTPVLFILKP